MSLTYWLKSLKRFFFFSWSGLTLAFLLVTPYLLCLCYLFPFKELWFLPLVVIFAAWLMAVLFFLSRSRLFLKFYLQPKRQSRRFLRRLWRAIRLLVIVFSVSVFFFKFFPWISAKEWLISAPSQCLEIALSFPGAASLLSFSWDLPPMQGLLFLAILFLFLPSFCLLVSYFFGNPLAFIGSRFLSPLALCVSFILGIAHQLSHFWRTIVLFSSRHVYSSPSYTGLLLNRFPRWYHWLLKMRYSKSFSQKRRAHDSRRRYLLFVWFFISFFFRALFLLPWLLCKQLFLWIYGSFSGAFAPSLGTLYYFFMMYSHRLYYHLLIPFKRTFRIFFFRFYVAFRRFSYYISVNDWFKPLHSLFEEKNRGAIEQRTIYNNYEMEWSYDKASPLSQPSFRDAVVKLFSKLFSFSPSLRLLRFPTLFALWLFSLLSLLCRSFFVLLWLFLEILFYGILQLLEKQGFLRFHRFAFLQFSRILAWFLSLNLGHLLMSSLEFFFFLLRSFNSRFSHLFFFLPFVLYNVLWLSLQLLAYLPLGLFRLLWSFFLFLRSRGALFVLALLLLFFFGPHLLLAFQQFLESWSSAFISFYLTPTVQPPGPYRQGLVTADFQYLLQGRIREEWLLKARTSRFHWVHMFYRHVWGPLGHVNPYKQEALWRKYSVSTLRRGWVSPLTHVYWSYLLYVEQLRFSIMLDSTSKLAMLYKLSILPPKLFYIHDAVDFYHTTLNLRWYTTLFLEAPYFYVSLRLIRLLCFLRSSLSLLCDYPYVGPIVYFYSNYYKALLVEPTLSFLEQLPTFQQVYSFGFPLVSALFTSLLEFLNSLYRSFVQTLGDLSIDAKPGDAILSFYFFHALWERQFTQQSPFSLSSLPIVIFYLPTVFLNYLLAFWSMLALPGEFSKLPYFSFSWLYLLSLSFAEKWADGLHLYWQLPKLLWGNYNLWSLHYRMGYETRNANTALRRMSLQRRGLFMPEHSFAFSLAAFLKTLLVDPSLQTTSYGAEIRPGFPRWKRLVPLVVEGKGVTLFRILNKPKFYAPWARHIGYLPMNPLPSSLQDYRLLKWPPLLNSLAYFPILFFLILLFPSFRAFFFPRLIEGGAQEYWEAFRRDKDLRLAADLVLPLLPSIESKRLEGLRRNRRGTPWVWLKLRDFDRLEKSSQAFLSFRQGDVREGLLSLWKTFPETATLPSLHSVRRLRSRWQSRLWTFGEDAGSTWGSSEDFYQSIYRYRFYDIKFLSMFRQLHELFYLQPKRLLELFRLRFIIKDFDFHAALTLSDLTMEEEEIRAEYLFQHSRVTKRLRLVSETKDYFQWLDGKLFDHRLGGIFLHKEGLEAEWLTHPASHILQRRLLRFRLTPQLFARFIQKRDYYFTVSEDPKVYPMAFFWLFIFPFLISIEGLFVLYAWKYDWSPRKARWPSSEYWALCTEIFFHFEVVSDLLSYFWLPLYASEITTRSGARGSIDDPQRWTRRSSMAIEFYSWAWVRRWNAQESLIFWNFSPAHWHYFASNTLSEQRLVTSIAILLAIFFLLLFFFRYSRRKPRFFILRRASVDSLKFSWVMLVQQLHYKQLKLNLKKGLLWFWLKG